MENQSINKPTNQPDEQLLFSRSVRQPTQEPIINHPIFPPIQQPIQEPANQIVQSILHSVSYNRTTKSYIQTALTQDQIDDIRQNYQTIIVDPNWKTIFKDIARKLSDELIPELSNTVVNNNYYEPLLYQIEDSKKLEKVNDTAITIGRMENIDIRLAPYDKVDLCSRVHAIILVMKNNDYIVVDVGSLTGVICQTRELNEKDPKLYPIVSSIPNSRKILCFKNSELSIMKFGSVTVTFNPRLCVVCMENPRDMIASCGHFSTCGKCTDDIKKKNNDSFVCPICRQDKITINIFTPNGSNIMQTNARGHKLI